MQIPQIRKVFLTHKVEKFYTCNGKAEDSCNDSRIFKKKRKNILFLILKIGLNNVEVDYKP